MKNLLLLSAFALVLCSSNFLFGQTSIKTAETPPAKLTFIVIYSQGPSWIKGKSVKEQPLKEHFQFMVGLFEKGVMKYAGPFGDGDGGAAVLEAADRKDAESIIAADPAVKSGIMTPTIHSWELVKWEGYLKK